MTLDEMKTRLASYIAAEAAILQAQEYTVGQGSTARRLTRADLAEVRKAITDLSAAIAGETAVAASRGSRLFYIRPRS